jgi:endonuclease YncB( thermonuclease family)
MARRYKFLILFLIFFIPVYVWAQNEIIKITYCYDGDTCTSSKGEKIRLACIDTPELRGTRAAPEKARAARDHLRSLLAGKEIHIKRIGKDRHGRTVGELFADGLNVQEEMVADGFAKIYKKYAFQCAWSK